MENTYDGISLISGFYVNDIIVKSQEVQYKQQLEGSEDYLIYEREEESLDDYF